jgi:hypothetical protein
MSARNIRHAWATIRLSVPVAFAGMSSLGAQATTLPSLPCFQVRYIRDSTEQTKARQAVLPEVMLPEGIQFSPSVLVARVWWDSTTEDGREMQKQVGRELQWRRLSRDSVVIVVVRSLGERLDVRMTVGADSLRGIMWLWADGPGLSIHPFVAHRAECPARYRVSRPTT